MTALCACILVTLSATSAIGEETELPTLYIGLGPLIHYSPSDICEAESDVVGCGPQAFVGLYLLPRWRVSPTASVGLVGSVSFGGGLSQQNSDGSHTDFLRMLWRLTGEGRYLFASRSPFGFWIGLEAGVAGWTERMRSFNSAGNSENTSSDSQLAPVFGPGVGGDFKVGEFLGLGLNLRGLLTLFPEDVDFHGGRRLLIGDAFWVTFSIDLTFAIRL